MQSRECMLFPTLSQFVPLLVKKAKLPEARVGIGLIFQRLRGHYA